MSLREAFEFYDKVINSSPKERAAVGCDHIDWLVAEARKAVTTIEQLEGDEKESVQLIDDLEVIIEQLQSENKTAHSLNDKLQTKVYVQTKTIEQLEARHEDHLKSSAEMAKINQGLYDRIEQLQARIKWLEVNWTHPQEKNT